MAKKTAKKTSNRSGTVAGVVDPPACPDISAPRPRLHKLRVSNFRCIGPTPVEIELDEIVVLVGPNNAGKTSILRAYQVAMSHGSTEGKLTIDDFPNSKPDASNPPTIELETVVYEESLPGSEWVRTDPSSGEKYVREQWTWTEPGQPKKVGWDVAAGKWHDSKGPWGTPNVAKPHRPQPHYVSAFDNPEQQAKEILALLTKALTERVKEISSGKVGGPADGEPSEYEKLLEAIKGLQRTIATDALTAVDDVRRDLSTMLGNVFPGYQVTFDARPEDSVEKAVNLFKTAPLLKLGPASGHQAILEHQGSGARRTLLWAALKILQERRCKESERDQPFLLLMDEPELCLHPDAIREACRLLYELPSSKNWQVMITTHSPVFIDFSRDNTSIVRVERDESGEVSGTTIYRPQRAQLTDDDKEELKMLNLCDPYIAEFFFGGKTIIVEGDTEYTALRYAISVSGGRFKNIHIVRARGKYPIASLCKILNQFGKPYAVLHDSDRPMTKVGKINSAWVANSRILDATADSRAIGNARVFASVPDFDRAFFSTSPRDEKPYKALQRIRSDESALSAVTALLEALLDDGKPIPNGVLEWESVADLEAVVAGQGSSASIEVISSQSDQAGPA